MSAPSLRSMTEADLEANMEKEFASTVRDQKSEEQECGNLIRELWEKTKDVHEKYRRWSAQR